MKKLIFVTIILFACIFLVVKYQKGSPFALSIKSSTTKSASPAVTIDGHTFHVEIAKTTQDKEIGLIKYPSIAQDFGMYFPFDQQGFYPFWMKNMRFPIDIIFIDKKEIVDIKESVPPANATATIVPTYAPDHTMDAVLEISSGLSQKYNFKVGDTIQTSGF